MEVGQVRQTMPNVRRKSLPEITCLDEQFSDVERYIPDPPKMLPHLACTQLQSQFLCCRVGVSAVTRYSRVLSHEFAVVQLPSLATSKQGVQGAYALVRGLSNLVKHSRTTALQR